MRESFPQPQESSAEKAEVEVALEAKLHLLAEQAGKPGASWKELLKLWEHADPDAKADIAYSEKDLHLIHFMANEKSEQKEAA